MAKRQSGKVAKLKNKNLILEIGCEELPVSHQKHIRKSCKSGPSLEGINHGNISIYTTPRRIVFYIENVAEKQEDRRKKVFGPPKNAAFVRIDPFGSSDGKPTRAAIGFAKSLGMDVKDLKIEKKGSGEYVCANITEKGKDTYSCLCEDLKYFITQLTFPKSMRWDESGIKFSRPIRWILALYGNEVIKFTIGSVKSDRFTYGNRLVSSPAEPTSAKKITIKEADIEEYKRALKKAYVIVDDTERGVELHNKMKECCKNYETLPPALFGEVVGLVEYPHAIKGKFSDEFLNLPPELIRTCMIEHLRFFPVVGENGKLQPHFISIVNNPSKSVEDAIRCGNENVLLARLDDAKFFYEHDINEGLDVKLERLKHIIFQEDMGSLYDKIERIKEISLFIAEKMKLEDTTEKIERAAILSKIDIGSQVVNEFPSLQGTMGRIYAMEFGEPDTVARAIEEQYLPRKEGDAFPQDIGEIGEIIGIADKIDNICTFFSQGYIATGSEDPFGARRDAQNLLIALYHFHSQVSIAILVSISELIDKGLNLIQNKIKSPNAKNEIMLFMRQRIETFLKEKSVEYDESDAIMNIIFEKNLSIALTIARVIQQFRRRSDFKKFIIAFKRVVNILKQANIDLKDVAVRFIAQKVDKEFLKEEQEKNLYKAYLSIKDEVENMIEKNKFEEAMETLLANLAKPIDDFFDHVLVMEKDENLRNNRLALLAEIANLFFLIADFSKIVLSETQVDKK